MNSPTPLEQEPLLLFTPSSKYWEVITTRAYNAQVVRPVVMRLPQLPLPIAFPPDAMFDFTGPAPVVLAFLNTDAPLPDAAADAAASDTNSVPPAAVRVPRTHPAYNIE